MTRPSLSLRVEKRLPLPRSNATAGDAPWTPSYSSSTGCGSDSSRRTRAPGGDDGLVSRCAVPANLSCVSQGARVITCSIYPPFDERDSLPYVHTTCILNTAMHDIQFAWDPAKATANARKHGVTFQEAQTAFFDDLALVIDDPDHSEGEARFVLLGLSAAARILVVVHAYRADPDTIRIISARKANKAERTRYVERFQ